MNSDRTHPGLRSVGLVVAALVLGATAAGCNYIAAAVVLTQGRGKTPAAVELDGSRKTVVLIDDLSNRVPRRSLRDDMGEAVDRALLKQKVIDQGNLISSGSARRAASGDTADDRMSAVDVGRKVGAEIVIYVTMTGWTLQQEPGFISPAASAQISILDTIANVRLWPRGERTHPFIARLPRVPASGTLSLAEKTKWEQALADRFGSELAKLFYEHEKELLSQQTRPGIN